MASVRGEVALEERRVTRSFLLTVISVAGLGALAIFASAPATLATDASAGVRAVLAAQVEAWNRGDLEGYMAGYWKSPDLVFFSNGQETRGWQATLDRYRARYQARSQRPAE